MGIIPDPTNDQQRDLARSGDGVGPALVNDFHSGVQTVRNFFSGSGSSAPAAPAAAASDSDSDIDPTTNQPRHRAAGGNFGSNWGWQEVLGSIIGAGGAYLCSSFLGGGWLGTIAFVLMLIPGVMLGRQFGHNQIRSMTGDSRPSASAPSGPEIAQSPDIAAPSAPSVSSTPSVAPVREQVGLLLERADAMQRVFDRRLSQGVAQGTLNSQLAQQQHATLEQQLIQLHRAADYANHNVNDPRAAQIIATLNNSLDGVLSRDPQLRQDVEQEIQNGRRLRGTVAINTTQQPQMGAVLSPADQAAIETMRTQGANYQGQPSELALREAPQFKPTAAQSPAPQLG